MANVLGSDNIDAGEPQYSAADTAAEDRYAAESEMTGKITQQEVDDLGGRANIMNDAPGVQTRGKKIDAMKQERDIDQAVDDATRYDYESGGQKVR